MRITNDNLKLVRHIYSRLELIKEMTDKIMISSMRTFCEKINKNKLRSAITTASTLPPMLRSILFPPSRSRMPGKIREVVGEVLQVPTRLLDAGTHED